MDLATIISWAIAAIGIFGFGAYWIKAKGLINQIKDFFVVLSDAIANDNISKEELKDIIAEALKIFTFWKSSDKEAVKTASKNNKKLTF